MGYLSNATILVDAILTKKGREKLASGTDNFSISLFALSDDELDYKLWNPNHTLGATYYGEAIEHLPILEAIADESLLMKYKLISLPIQTIYGPTVSVTPTSFALISPGASVTLTPSTYPANAQLYSATINNTTDFTLVATEQSTGGGGMSTDSGMSMAASGAGGGATVQTSQTAVGSKFKVTSKNYNNSTRSCIVTITGIDTGGTATASGTAYAYVTSGGGNMSTN
jgi:hypothetical protein